MDIHRCRFVPYPCSAINALAFSHTHSPNLTTKAPPNLRLAIGRANGDVEIWNPSGGEWYQESILRGGKDRSIEGLVWTQDPGDQDKAGNKLPGKLRLFSIGYSPTVTEWDLAQGKPAKHWPGDFNDVWCIAAQPRTAVGKKDKTDEPKSEEAQKIALGLADGGIILLSTSDGDLQFHKTLTRQSKKGARVLCLTYQDASTIVAGHADGVIRIFDVRNGQQMRNLTLGAGPKDGPREILVWALRSLPDGSLVSGDSTGTLCFWDAKTHTLSQRIKAHEADILALAVSADGKSVFSGGMDRQTVLYRRSGSEKDRKRSRWAKITHSRLHDHDLKTMATYESQEFSALVSGGLDTNAVLMPIREFGYENHRRLPGLAQRPALLSAPEKRLIVSWWDREIRIWAMSRRGYQQAIEDGFIEDDGPEGRRLVAKMSLQGEETINGVDITENGSILAVATISEVKVFRLSEQDHDLKIQKAELQPRLKKTGGGALKFSPDKKWLAIVTTTNNVQLRRLILKEDSGEMPLFYDKIVKLHRLQRQPVMLKSVYGSLGSYDRTIRDLAFSDDGHVLAAIDQSGYIDTWVLEGHEDLMETNGVENSIPLPLSDSKTSDSDEENDHTPVVLGQRWIRNPSASLLPKVPIGPLVFSFRPSFRHQQQALTNGNTAVHATRHNPHPHSHDLPHGEDRLLVITSGNQVFEFNVLAGKMSDWSRQNPSSTFPQGFRNLRDPAKGVIWDITASKERMWLYGVNWLWMFDLKQNMPSSASVQSNDALKNSQQSTQEPLAKSPLTNGVSSNSNSLKRKRPPSRSSTGNTLVNRRPNDTGAGSLIRDSELTVGIGRKMHLIEGSSGEVTRIIDLNAQNQRHIAREDSTSSADEDDDGVLDDENDDEEQSDNIQTVAGNNPGGDQGLAQNWHTLKYRPILGIVPLSHNAEDSDSDSDSGPEINGDVSDQNHQTTNGTEDTFEDVNMEEAQPEITEKIKKAKLKDGKILEVVLVERPLWDLELPPRFYGTKDWDK